MNLTMTGMIMERQRTKRFFIGTLVSAGFLALVGTSLARSLTHQSPAKDVTTVASTAKLLVAPITRTEVLAAASDYNFVLAYSKSTQSGLVAASGVVSEGTMVATGKPKKKHTKKKKTHLRPGSSSMFPMTGQTSGRS